MEQERELKNKINCFNYESIRERLVTAYHQYQSGDYEECFETLKNTNLPYRRVKRTSELSKEIHQHRFATPDDLTQFMQAI
jgi:hypothetical protein